MSLIYQLNMAKWVAGMLLIAVAFSSCKKLAEVDPPVTSTTGESVFSADITAIAVLTGMYAQISSTAFNATSGLPVLSKKAGLSADELSLWSGASTADIPFYENALGSKYVIAGINFSSGFEFWNTCYSYIFTCNSAIEGLAASTTLTPAVKQQLMGEAKFMRAFCYFYLVNLYGDAPLAISADYQINRLLPRSPKSQVYQQIISDLQEATNLLSTDYLDGTLLKTTTERVRPTNWAATALLARAYLYMGDYANAEAAASNLINNAAMFSLTTLNNAFLANSNEAIWQLQPVNTNGDQLWNTEDARLFVLTAAPVGLSTDKPVYLSPSLLAAFETGDNRVTNWVGSYTDGTGTYYFPYKYQAADPGTSVTEYLMALRLAEQYLIRAEARAQQNNTGGAQTDLNAIRTRADLPNTSAADKASLLTAILHERQVELFTEWGHRWLDLKRMGKVDAVMSVITPLKANGAAWKSFQQWYPLPIEDIQRDPNLVQNTGY